MPTVNPDEASCSYICMHLMCPMPHWLPLVDDPYHHTRYAYGRLIFTPPFVMHAGGYLASAGRALWRRLPHLRGTGCCLWQEVSGTYLRNLRLKVCVPCCGFCSYWWGVGTHSPNSQEVSVVGFTPLKVFESGFDEVGPLQQQALRRTTKAAAKKGKGKGKGKKKANPKQDAKVPKGKTKTGQGKGKAKHDVPQKLSKGNSKASKADSRVKAGLGGPEARKLGCPTCRFAAKGCHICRKPNYRPRGPRTKKP